MFFFDLFFGGGCFGGSEPVEKRVVCINTYIICINIYTHMLIHEFLLHGCMCFSTRNISNGNCLTFSFGRLLF